jgi:catechol 2,3-dioxygenase-like lactoylglutathione lyase family enzyme
MGLNHVNIRTRDLERMRTFLEDVAEVRAGPRPDFDFPGYWLYCGDLAVFHLVGIEADEDGIAGSVDHVALDGFKLEPKRKALEAAGHEFRVGGVPGTGVRQIFVTGPDGIAIELQCTE